MTADPWCRVCGEAPCCHGEQSDADLIEMSVLQAQLNALKDAVQLARIRAEIAEHLAESRAAELRDLKEAGTRVLISFCDKDTEALRAALLGLNQRCKP